MLARGSCKRDLKGALRHPDDRVRRAIYCAVSIWPLIPQTHHGLESRIAVAAGVDLLQGGTSRAAQVVELPVPMYAKRVDTLVTDFLARGLVEQVKEACAKEASLLEGASRYVRPVLFPSRKVNSFRTTSYV